MKFFRRPTIESSLTYLVLGAVLLTMTGIGYFFFGGLISLPLAGRGGEGAFEVKALTIGDTTINFPYTDENEDEDLIIHADRKIYGDFKHSDVYFAFTPIRKIEGEEISLQFLFGNDGAKVERIEKREGEQWQSLTLMPVPVEEDTKLAESFARRKVAPSDFASISHARFSSTGQTQYFRAQMTYPMGVEGEFWIEAFGDRGSYGLLDPWYNSSWSYRKKITIGAQSSAGSTGLTNFPMLFSRTDSDLKDTNNSGYVASSTAGDIVFTDWDGIKIDHEIETYTNTTGNLIAWIEVPFVSSTSTRDIYMYYGNSSATYQPTNASTWDSNFKGVWHLPNGTTLTANDSTSNANNGTISTPTARAGQIDGGADFNGTSDNISVGTTNMPANNANQTMTAWFQFPTAYPSGRTMLFSLENSSGSSALRIGFEATAGKPYVNKWGGTDIFTAGSAPSVGSWHLYTYTFNGTTHTVYMDGVSLGTSTVAAQTSAPAQVAIGMSTVSGWFFPDFIDEVRVSSSVRSADWIKTEYNNQSSPSTFYSVSGQDAQTRSSSTAGVKFAARAGSALSWYNSSWGYRKKITINKTDSAGSTGLTNFPMLFSRTDPELRDTSNSGYVASSTAGDIVFTDWDGIKIDHEIETYTNTTGNLIAWVEVPFISSSSTRDIYMYYGNSSATYQPTNASTWDSNFKGVWHLPNGTTLTANDSTSNAINSTAITTPTAASAKIDGGANFVAASSDKINFGSVSALDVGNNVTVEAWINTADDTNLHEFFLHGDYATAPYAGYQLIKDNAAVCSPAGRVIYSQGYSTPNGINHLCSAAAVSNNVWHHIVGTWNGSTMYLYIDGAQNATVAETHAAPITTDQRTTIGYSAVWGNYLNGKIDEVRVSNSARSADWIKTEYNNQSKPASFYSVGAQDAQVRSSSTPTIKSRGGIKLR